MIFIVDFVLYILHRYILLHFMILRYYDSEQLCWESCNAGPFVKYFCGLEVDSYCDLEI